MTLPPEMTAAAEAILGMPIASVRPTSRGESRSTYRITTNSGSALLKLVADGPGVLDNQQRLNRIVNDLRGRGYPAPEYLGAGAVGGHVFTLQEWVAGQLLEPGPGLPPPNELFQQLLPDLLTAVELQRDTGDLAAPPWPQWLLDTIDHGGDGYCIHATMQERPDTKQLLERLQALRRRCDPARDRPRTTDVVHFDLNPANILHDGRRLRAVVDWNVPFTGASQGDRGFDVATLLFYSYEIDATRPRLWAHALAISGRAWTTVYLCHLVLRQVEWTVRHAPGTPEEQRFLRLAQRVLDDCERF